MFFDFAKYDLMTYLNTKFPHYKYAVINKEIFPAVVSRTGEKYCIHPDLITYLQSREQYSVEGLKSSDLVIDLGANIGAFSFRCAKFGCKVHAFEPLEYMALWKNIQLNDLFDVVIPYHDALGNGDTIDVEWRGKKQTMPTRTFTYIKKICGGCDFLKCDVEGAEWFIHPDELQDVRRIEMEFHMFSPYANKSKIQAYDQYFDMEFRDLKGETLWYSGTNKYV